MAESLTLREWIAALGRRVDARLPAALHAAVSVDAGRVRRWLRAADRPFVDPEGGEVPGPAELERTARWVIQQKQAKLALVGGLAGLAGAVSVPPETLADTVGLLRLAQRLAVVYGFDPATDRGTMAVWRALSAGFELDLPGEGPVGLRASEMPGVLVNGARSRYTGGALATAMVRETAWRIGRRLSRLVPLPFLSSGLSAARAHGRTDEIGQRMAATLQRLSEAPPVDPDRIEDAIEVG